MMKIRSGFVSNSSSSSFIITGKGEAKINIEVDVTEFGQVLKTKEDLDTYYIEDCELENIEELKAYSNYSFTNYTEALKAINAGETVIICEVSNEDEDLMSLYLYDNINELKIPGYKFIKRGN